MKRVSDLTVKARLDAKAAADAFNEALLRAAQPKRPKGVTEGVWQTVLRLREFIRQERKRRRKA